jgi:predicted nucleic acid-binding protein
VLIPALVAWHPQHDVARQALDKNLTALAAHVLVECYSVLTRLPAPHRFSAQDAGALLSALDVKMVALPAGRHRAMLAALAEAGVRGGAVYDGVVAATARHHDLHLLTRDRRARTTYDSLGVAYTMV